MGRAARLGPRGLQPGNLLFAEGRLGAVIDFGRRRPGGPAVDLLAARYVPAAEARPLFRAALDAGEATWARGRGWALTIALMGLHHYRGTNPRTAAVARHVGHEARATTVPSAGRGRAVPAAASRRERAAPERPGWERPDGEGAGREPAARECPGREPEPPGPSVRIRTEREGRSRDASAAGGGRGPPPGPRAPRGRAPPPAATPAAVEGLRSPGVHADHGEG
ncbi:phosphotransferase, partial [Streptomyces wuyuanensis]|uniref:phosphotransferase n=1 Tax=Streptomyces wuyuanensis TaxID=1196353 RepID=UPI0036D0CAA7